MTYRIDLVLRIRCLKLWSWLMNLLMKVSIFSDGNIACSLHVVTEKAAKFYVSFIYWFIFCMSPILPFWSLLFLKSINFDFFWWFYHNFCYLWSVQYFIVQCFIERESLLWFILYVIFLNIKKIFYTEKF